MIGVVVALIIIARQVHSPIVVYSLWDAQKGVRAL